jgi:hypothetical protein
VASGDPVEVDSAGCSVGVGGASVALQLDDRYPDDVASRIRSRSLDGTQHRRLADDWNGQRDDGEAPDRLKSGGLAGRAEPLLDEGDELAKRSSELALKRRCPPPHMSVVCAIVVYEPLLERTA